MSQEITVERVTEYSADIAAGIGRLMPYLDENFSSEPVARAGIEEIIASPYHDQLVAVRNNIEIVGATSLTVVLGLGLGRRGQMEDVIVDPNTRRQGVGLKLMLAAEDWCRDQRLAFLLLQTESFREDAIRLYEKWGAYLVKDVIHGENERTYRKDINLDEAA